ncbi:MAG: DUF2142 domain-containing protein [Trueperella sp.]|nr:DUF2142 domain-containing protein [Trueperella sp.]
MTASSAPEDPLSVKISSWKTSTINLLRLVGIPLALLITLLTWTVSTAPYGEPDAPYHLSSIYCAHGNWEGVCEEVADPTQRLIRTDAATAVCYKQDSGKSAACLEDYYNRSSQKVTHLGNFHGNYPEIYFKTARLVVGHNTELNFIAVRTLNSVLVTLITAAIIALAAPQRRSPIWLALAVTMVPLGISTIASINPSSWAIFSPALVFVAVASSFERTGWRRWTLCVLAGFSFLMAAGSRADASIYAALALLAALFLKTKFTRKMMAPLTAGILISVGAVVLLVVKGRAGYVDPGAFVKLITSSLQGSSNIFGNLQNVAHIWSGIFGTWGLGWFDVPIPHNVPYFGLFAFAAVMFIGLSKMSVRSTILVAVIAAVLVVLPIFTLHQRQLPVGAFVQPRYMLPLLVLLAVVIIWNWDNHPLSRPQKFILGTFLSGANAISLYAVIVRYRIGLSGTITDKWWSNYAPTPAVTLAISALFFTLFIVGILTWPPLSNPQLTTTAGITQDNDAEMPSPAA